MLNVVAHRTQMSGAVLIRALQPTGGLERIRRNRGDYPDVQLTNGPAKLAIALGIGDKLNGVDLCQTGSLFITDGRIQPNEIVESGPRVRVPGDETARARPWRFWIKDNAYVSR
jgi:DNA-3-methyladenine glycosylase